MGVKDLWQLLSPIGRRISIETLEGKALAIDMSIWLTQFIKAMRDEEGKMIKNAHIIGTLRRILKLLFHRIRPLFVFDGATPSLKLNVIQRRRKIRERSESTRKAALHRVLLNHLKEQIKEAQNKKEGKKDDQYASSFNAPAPPAATIEEKTPASTQSILSENQKHVQSNSKPTEKLSDDQFRFVEADDSDIEWEGGYETLKSKDLDAESNGSDEEDLQYNLPETYQQLNVEVLASLPVPMRKQIVEELRRKERIKSRNTYIPVADNPVLYSQTQLANFLKTSKLNRKVEAAQKYLDGSDQGRRIASEGHKKIFLTKAGGTKEPSRREELPWSDEESSENESSFSASRSSGSALQKCSRQMVLTSSMEGDQFEDILFEEEEIHEENDRNHSSNYHGEEEMVEEVEGAGFFFEEFSPNKGKKRKSVESSSGLSTTTKHRRLQKTSEFTTQDESRPSANSSSSINPAAIEFLEQEEDMQNLEESLNPSNSINIKIEEYQAIERGGFLLDDDNESLPKPSATRHVQFYDSLHYDSDEASNPPAVDLASSDDEEDDDLEDMEWEQEELQPQEPIVNEAKVTNDNHGKIDRGKENHFEREDEETEVEESSLKLKRTTSLPVLFPPLESSQLLPESINNTLIAPATVSNIDRAIATASNMADWAGRVVRKALKEHAQLKDPSISATSTTVSADYLIKREGDLSTSSNILSSSSQTNPLHSTGSITNNVNKAGTDWNKISEQIALAEAAEEWRESESIPIDLTASSNSNPLDPIPNNSSSGHQNTTDHFASEVNEDDDMLHLDEEEEEELLTETDPVKLKKILASSARDSERLTEDMKNDVMELLRAFDLPYLIAPFEAEAQCAVLEQLGLVDGVVTEDSDSFLFGARAVYKNIFNDKKFVEVYLVEDAERELGLSREDFITLAYFLGSDYTEGINGVGIVNAMEILQAFPFEKSEEGILQGLEKFRNGYRDMTMWPN